MARTVFIYISDLGDGSACPVFFSTRELAEAYADEDDQRFCDDILECDLDDLDMDPSRRHNSACKDGQAIVAWAKALYTVGYTEEEQ